MEQTERSGASGELETTTRRSSERNGIKRHDGDHRRFPWVRVGIGTAATVALAVLRGKANGKSANRLTLATALVSGATLLDALVAARQGPALPHTVSVRASVTIRRSREDLYRYWRDLRNLPRFMRHVSQVTEQFGHSIWHAEAPGGVALDWEAEIVADKTDERIAWRSVEGTTLPNHGSVEFRNAPRELGTEVHLQIGFEPPGGAVGAALARLFDELPEQQLKNDLRRLKQLMETGEIVHSDASIHRGMHPARPPKYEQTPLINGLVQS
jgi:uncharacterized membrane protein